MIRRKLTLKRVDPWTVLKFGLVVNIVLLLVACLAFWIVWVTIGRLGLVEQFCGSVGTIVLDLQECSLNGGNIFQTFLFLGALGVVVQTGIFVFAAFLYNLIADLTGGLSFSFLDESSDAVLTSSRRADTAAQPSPSGASSGQQRSPTPGPSGGSSGPGARPSPTPPAPSSSTAGSPSGAGAAAGRPTSSPAGAGGSAATAPRSASRPADQPSDPARSTPDGERSPTREEEDRRRDRERRPSSTSGSLWDDPTRSRNS